MRPELLISSRTRSTPFSNRVEACGVKAYSVYNHMLLPLIFRSLEEDYWHLCESVQVWDVSCQRQVEITGPDTQKLVQLMTPRDLSQAELGQCFYAPLCDETGGMINDPILIKHSNNHWWLSIADSDVMLWAKGLATGFGLDALVKEPDIWPLAVQGPKAEELLSRVFGKEISKILFFRSSTFNYQGTKMLVARSGWSKQGGFEIYVNDAELGGQLWDELFAKGEDLNVGPGCPNLIERIESGLLGKRRIKPIVSVKKPGVSNTSPATPINKASSSSPEGILPSRRLSWIRNKVCNPCIRAKYAPRKPVKMTRAIEVSAPNTVPIFISR